MLAPGEKDALLGTPQSLNKVMMPQTQVCTQTHYTLGMPSTLTSSHTLTAHPQGGGRISLFNSSAPIRTVASHKGSSWDTKPTECVQQWSLIML